MDFEVESEGGRARLTLVGLFAFAIVSVVLIATAIPNVSASKDVAGQSPYQHRNGSTCVKDVTLSQSWSAQPASAPSYAQPFYTETDLVQQFVYSNLQCTGNPTQQTTYTSVNYPVTPAMVSTVCSLTTAAGNSLGTTLAQCGAYPQYIIQALYPCVSASITCTAPSGQVPLLTLASVRANSLVTWEAVGG